MQHYTQHTNAPLQPHQCPCGKPMPALEYEQQIPDQLKPVTNAVVVRTSSFRHGIQSCQLLMQRRPAVNCSLCRMSVGALTAQRQ